MTQMEEIDLIRNNEKLFDSLVVESNAQLTRFIVRKQMTEEEAAELSCKQALAALKAIKKAKQYP